MGERRLLHLSLLGWPTGRRGTGVRPEDVLHRGALAAAERVIAAYIHVPDAGLAPCLDRVVLKTGHRRHEILLGREGAAAGTV